MATATQEPVVRQQSAVAKTADDAMSLLDVVIEKSQSARDGVRAALMQHELVESLLPPGMKGQGRRLCERAALEFERNADLAKCTPKSFVRCVLRAAEIGLAIDGKLAYAVPFNVKVSKKEEKPERWEMQATLIPSYMGLVAVAKRSGQIVECYGDNVCENDDFINRRVDDRTEFRHERPKLGEDRGERLGAYVVIKLTSGFRTEVMDKKQLKTIRDISKMKDGPAWRNNPEQMEIKTVIRRALKLYCDDPGFVRACEIDDEEIDGIPVNAAYRGGPSRVRQSTLQEKLQSLETHAPTNGHAHPIDDSHDAVDERPADEPTVEADPTAAITSDPTPLDILIGDLETCDDIKACNLAMAAFEAKKPSSEDYHKGVDKTNARIEAVRPARGDRAKVKQQEILG